MENYVFVYSLKTNFALFQYFVPWKFSEQKEKWYIYIHRKDLKVFPSNSESETQKDNLRDVDLTKFSKTGRNSTIVLQFFGWIPNGPISSCISEGKFSNSFRNEEGGGKFSIICRRGRFSLYFKNSRQKQLLEPRAELRSWLKSIQR